MATHLGTASELSVLATAITELDDLYDNMSVSFEGHVYAEGNQYSIKFDSDAGYHYLVSD